MPGRRSDPLPSFRVDPTEVPRDQRFEAWHEIARPLYDTAPLTDERKFEARWEGYILDDLMVTWSAPGPHRVTRGLRHLRDTPDQLGFWLFIQGQTVQLIGDHPVAQTPGVLSMVDMRQQVQGRSDGRTSLGIMIPCRRVDTSVFDRAPIVAWRDRSPEGRVLSSAAMTLWAELPRARAADAAILAAGFTGLLNGLLATRPSPEQRTALDNATLRAMQQHIESRLDDPELDATALCRGFHCSRARLYRLFSPLDGVERHIRDRRLRRCFRELTRADPIRGRVRTVAERWGFDDASHFHRLFKERFTIAPSDVPRLVGDARAPKSSAATRLLPTGGADFAELQRFYGHLRAAPPNPAAHSPATPRASTSFGCRPSRIASTMSGARQVSGRSRQT